MRKKSCAVFYNWSCRWISREKETPLSATDGIYMFSGSRTGKRRPVLPALKIFAGRSRTVAAFRPDMLTAAFRPNPPTAAFHPDMPTVAFWPNTPTAAFHPDMPTVAFCPNTPTAAFRPNPPTAAFRPKALTPWRIRKKSRRFCIQGTGRRRNWPWRRAEGCFLLPGFRI